MVGRGDTQQNMKEYKEQYYVHQYYEPFACLHVASLQLIDDARYGMTGRAWILGPWQYLPYAHLNSEDSSNPPAGPVPRPQYPLITC